MLDFYHGILQRNYRKMNRNGHFSTVPLTYSQLTQSIHMELKIALFKETALVKSMHTHTLPKGTRKGR